MRPLIAPPFSDIEPVTEVLHGVPITDPYRWLEDQDSPRTRAWIEMQTQYARGYLEAIPGRQRIRERVRAMLDVETYDSFVKKGNRFFFCKRRPGEEQPSIYLRQGMTGQDALLVNPADRRTGDYTAVKPLRVSPDGNLLLYDIKQGGERTGTFEILDVRNRKTLADSLPRGYLRGFAFSPDSKSFYYVHEPSAAQRPSRAVFQHVLGSHPNTDREIFCAGEDPKLRLILVSGPRTLGFLVQRFLEKTYTDFYLQGMKSSSAVVPILRNADYSFAPRLLPGRILADVNQPATQRRIVEVQARYNLDPVYFNLIREAGSSIRHWALTANHIIVSFVRGTQTQIVIFNQFGERVTEVPVENDETARVVATCIEDDDFLLERESFTRPIEILHYALKEQKLTTWARRSIPSLPSTRAVIHVSFSSTGGTTIPMSLVGRKTAIAEGSCPVIMTAYGGYGIPMTPQFSVLVTALLERGCVFALPNIRGGTEFGTAWHDAARRRNRQAAIDDFLAAAQWLMQGERPTASKLAIFGGSNSGLLVAAAMTQRPDLFRAVLCMVPLLDMLRYHLFDGAHTWKEEFGTADAESDFRCLLGYSPYHSVRDGSAYPATMFVSGDVDQNCNPLHARKMTARLQAANCSDYPVFLDYSAHRGHSPVLPLSTRISALTDRIAFFCDQLALPD